MHLEINISYDPLIRLYICFYLFHVNFTFGSLCSTSIPSVQQPYFKHLQTITSNHVADRLARTVKAPKSWCAFARSWYSDLVDDPRSHWMMSTVHAKPFTKPFASSRDHVAKKTRTMDAWHTCMQARICVTSLSLSLPLSLPLSPFLPPSLPTSLSLSLSLSPSGWSCCCNLLLPLFWLNSHITERGRTTQNPLAGAYLRCRMSV